MKITFVLPFASLAGGIRVVATYARRLHDKGHEVHVVSQPFQPPLRRRERLGKMLGLYTPPTHPGTPLLDFLGDRHRVLEAPRPVTAADVPDADIIMATWWETALWVAALPASKGRKFHLLQDYEMFENLPLDRVAASFSLDLQKIAVSDYIRQEVETHHGVTGIKVVPNAVDMAQFNAPARPKNQTLTVGFVYTGTPRKNVGLALKALEAAKARLPHLRAVAFGATDPMPHLPLPDWVQYHQAPAQADIPGIYAQCDLWLFTSDNEGFGLPILEAMACRTPVLATHAGAAPELVNDTNGALLASEVSAFAEAIMRFDAMPDAEWQTRSEAAYRTTATYTWDDATTRLLACFDA